MLNSQALWDLRFANNFSQFHDISWSENQDENAELPLNFDIAAIERQPNMPCEQQVREWFSSRSFLDGLGGPNTETVVRYDWTLKSYAKHRTSGGMTGCL